MTTVDDIILDDSHAGSDDELESVETELEVFAMAGAMMLCNRNRNRHRRRRAGLRCGGRCGPDGRAPRGHRYWASARCCGREGGQPPSCVPQPAGTRG
jgi:hypothetical protein